ncbi:MAG: DUF4388 domain-containing protein [Candidatus Coatesbacteria bacterium]|nr:DUF4388 domain-containing protein [Candidatus Coatesbacteria bacterium]
MPFDGDLKDFALPDILQMLQMGKRTGALSIRRGEDIGTLYFRKGELVHATFANMTGEDAAYALLKWKNGRFRFDTTIYPTRRTIDISATNLILESARRSDELRDLQTELPPPDTVLTFAKVEGAHDDIHLSPQQWKVLALIDGARTITEICAVSDQDEVTVLQTLEEMINIGLVRRVGDNAAGEEEIDLDEEIGAPDDDWDRPPGS